MEGDGGRSRPKARPPRPAVSMGHCHKTDIAPGATTHRSLRHTQLRRPFTSGTRCGSPQEHSTLGNYLAPHDVGHSRTEGAAGGYNFEGEIRTTEQAKERVQIESVLYRVLYSQAHVNGCKKKDKTALKYFLLV